MDSLTQLALGAAVGDATLGPRTGRLAIVWGAVLGTVPDLDILIPIADDVAAFTEHRSWSHSIFVLSAAAPIIALGLARMHAARGISWRRWLWFTWSIFATHVLLDCCTAYGTQILWPMPTPPVAWASVFIIDPLYTIPLLVGLGMSVRFRHRDSRRASRWNTIGLVASSMYLAWTLVAQQIVTHHVATKLEQEGLEPRVTFITPTPLNSLVWRIVTVHDDGYREGFFSLLSDDVASLSFEHHVTADVAEAGLLDIAALSRLAWFTRGVHTLRIDDGELVFVDLRMGALDTYVFQFAIARREGARWVPIEPRKLESSVGLDRLTEVWRRL